MEDTIFDNIIRREIPADILYEDEETLAFLDISPCSPGHTLVIPKKQVRNLLDVDQETLNAVMSTIRKVAPALMRAVGAEGININTNNEAAAGQVVFHLHVHLIPRFANDGLPPWPHKSYGAGEAATIAEKIRTILT